MSAPACPICTSPTSLFLGGVYDDRYGCPGRYDLYHCAVCGHKHLAAAFSDTELAALYNTYYPRVTFNAEEVAPFREQRGVSAWLEGVRSFAYTWVPRAVRVLDIGCGYGETLGYHAARGCEAYGVETDVNVQRVADRFGCTFHAGLFDHKNYPAEHFDYITLDQVVEHFARPVESMAATAKILKRNGTVVVCTPNSGGWGARTFGRRWINWHIPYHLNLFSVDSMRRLADQAGFVLERHATITSSKWLYYQLCSLIRYPRSGEPSVYWSTYYFPERKDRIRFKAVELLDRMKLPHLLTRVFDLAGLGDNHVFILRKK
jgi:SAM-dependent methyltransferase